MYNTIMRCGTRNKSLFDFTTVVAFVKSHKLRTKIAMRKITIPLILRFILFTLVISACGKAAQQPSVPALTTSQPVVETPLEDTAELQTGVPTPLPPVATELPQWQISTHQDPTYGFTFDYPVEWFVDQISFGSRAPASYQLTSWDHEPGLVDKVPAGETIMNITIQLWDPKNDLQGFIDSRMMAWEASGFTITKTEDLVLKNGNPAKAYQVTTPDGSAGYFLFSTVGEDYLVISGNGNLELIDLVARSLR